MDLYVIRGVGHNVAFLRDIMSHPRFESGAITTQYIREEYPEGFHGVEVTPTIANTMAATAAVMQAVQDTTAFTISGRSPYAKSPSALKKVTVWLHFACCCLTHSNFLQIIVIGESEIESMVTQVEGANNTWKVRMTPLKNGEAVGLSKEEEVTFSNVEWNPGAPLFLSDVNGKPIIAQHLEATAEGFRVQLEGAISDVVCIASLFMLQAVLTHSFFQIVRTPVAHKYANHMLPKPEIDYSKILVSPMPGKLISIDVEPGQYVRAYLAP